MVRRVTGAYRCRNDGKKKGKINFPLYKQAICIFSYYGAFFLIVIIIFIIVFFIFIVFIFLWFFSYYYFCDALFIRFSHLHGSFTAVIPNAGSVPIVNIVTKQ